MEQHLEPGRIDQLRRNLSSAQSQIAQTCEQVDRNPAEVSLIVVTKSFPANDIRLLAELGVSNVGENRDQEARVKWQQAARWSLAAPLQWHFIGQLQTNKASSVASYADFVHSVDRPTLITALQAGALRAQRMVACLIQIQLDDNYPAGRGGAAPNQLLSLAAAITEASHLKLAGVMAVAPQRSDPSVAFGRLADLHESLLMQYPQATIRSAGMSRDFPAAIAQGATHLRLGSMILGERRYLR